MPSSPAHILDIGTGAGQNAAALAELGYQVTALDPMIEFLQAAQKTYQHLPIQWINTHLPELDHPDIQGNSLYDFILIEGVWHHINETQRTQAMKRIFLLLKPGGRCAMSLRNGPSGLGTHVFPTDSKLTTKLFESYGFKCLLHLENLPSIMKHKKNVFWSRIVFEKLS